MVSNKMQVYLWDWNVASWCQGPTFFPVPPLCSAGDIHPLTAESQ